MDIDIDLKSDFDPKNIFPEVICASMVRDDQLVKHNVGVYFQKIPIDSLTGLAAIPYEQAEEVGYFKVDFLHLSLLDEFETKEEIRALINAEPDWSLLLDPDVVSKLFQIHRHFDIVSVIRPQSVQELADVIAIIRPGKRALLDKYIKNRDAVRPFLYRQDDEDKSAFRRSHAIAYALNIVLQLHLIRGGLL